MNNLLEINNIKKFYGSVRAVDGISLNINQNEFFGLLGASGSGKTTLLRMLAGFETHTQGDIKLAGEDISDMPPNMRPINLMFQSYALFPHMTVRQNIAYGLEMEKIKKDEIKTRVSEMLNVIQLNDEQDRKPEQLSGGQKQRVALARALIKRPKLLLLDEPLAALDKKLRGEMQLELKRIQEKFGITFIVVTHDQEEALVMADRIAILKDGKIIQCGTPNEIYEEPNSKYSAEFIGMMNFLDVRVQNGKLKARDGKIIKPNKQAKLSENKKMVVAVRPERLELKKTKGGNTIKGDITEIAYHGTDMLIYINTTTSSMPVMARVTAKETEGNIPKIGNEIEVGWSAQNTHLFQQ